MSFPILDQIKTKLRRVGPNYVTRCPSCAEGGHDRSGDNLAISIEGPRKYICWAGCKKEMIREAVGCPIRYRHFVREHWLCQKFYENAKDWEMKEIGVKALHFLQTF